MTEAGYRIVNLDCVVARRAAQTGRLPGRHPPPHRRHPRPQPAPNRPQSQNGRRRRPRRPRRSYRSPLRRTDWKPSGERRTRSRVRPQLSEFWRIQQSESEIRNRITMTVSTRTKPDANEDSPRPSHAARLQHALEAQGAVRHGASRAKSASISAGPRSTTRPTSATWSGP